MTAAGVDSPVLDARLLLERATGVARIEILTDPYRELAPEAVLSLEALVQRREAREPVSHILGRRAFWNFELAVTPDVLTPRPETEFLVQAALERTPIGAAPRVLDLGVGSGAILLAILNERPAAHGVGLDLSPAALAVARANAQRLGLADRTEWLEAGFAAAPLGPFDLIVSNPPYIPADEIQALQPEVARFEPRLALDGGADGLDAYRTLAPLLAPRLTQNGTVLLEVGAGQASHVQLLLAEAGLIVEEVRRDLAGHGRVILARR